MRRSPKLISYVIPLLIFLSLDYIVTGKMLYILLIILLPLALVIIFDKMFIAATHFYFPIRRVFFQDFLNFFIAGVYFLILSALFPHMPFVFSAVIAATSTALMRSMVFFVYYTERAQYLILPSMMYTISTLIPALVLMPSANLLIDAVISSLIFTAGGISFAYFPIRRFTKEFGQSPISILNFFLNIHSKSDTETGNMFFSKLYGNKRTVPVKIVSIENMNHARKVLMIFPYVHPGPFGSIGTSNLPSKLQERLADLSTDVMVFHTSTTNSNNSASDADVDTIAEGVRSGLENLAYTDVCTKIKKMNSGKISVSMIRIGNFGIGSLIPEREKFDDVSLTEGLKITERMKQSGADDFIVVDAQNHFSHGASALSDCSLHSKTFEREFAKNEPKNRIIAGYSRVEGKSPGLGPMGIQCIVFSNQGKYQAVVLTDSNNIKDEVMGLAEKKVDGLVSNLDIFTTDNHYVNQGTLDMNPLGERDDNEFVSDLIKESVEKAISNCEECVAGEASTDVTVSMGEENMFEKLLTSVFSSLKGAKYSIFGIVAVTVISSFLVFSLHP